MKRIVIRYGFIAGLLVTAWMVGSIAMCYRQDDFEGNIWLGYASMILAFAFIFVGVKSYRDKELGGTITFVEALKTGLLISGVASTIYVVVWLVDYYVFIPDFMEKFSAHSLNQIKAEGVSPLEFKERAAEMENFKQMYKNPLLVVLITYAEILPVGIIVSLITALVLKKKSTESLMPA